MKKKLRNDVLKKYICGFIIVITAFSLSIFTQVIFNDSDNIKYYENVEQNLNFVKVQIQNSIGYNIEGDLYTVTQNDPQMYLSTSGNTKLINLSFAEPLSEKLSIQAFYYNDNQPISENHSVNYQIFAKESSILIEIPGDNVDLLRLDIGKNKGEEFRLSQIVVSDQQILFIDKFFAKVSIVQTISLTLIFVLIIFVVYKYNYVIIKSKGVFLEKISKKIATRKKLAFFFCFALVTFVVLIVFFLKFYIEISPSLYLPTYIITGILISYFSIWAVLYLKIIENKISLNLLCASIVLLTGIMYLFVITPYSEPDAPYHYNSSYKMSNILMFNFDGLNEVNENHYTYYGLDGHYNTSQWYDIIEETGLAVNNIDRAVEMSAPSDTLSYPVLYLPQALGIAFARLLNLNYIGVFFLGRLFNLLFFSGAVYASMRIIPRFKLSVFAIAMIPITLQLASGFTYDTVVNALALLFLSTVVSAIFRVDHIITMSEKVRLIIFGVLLCPAKVVYALLLPLVFLIPVKRFAKKRQYFGFLGLFGIACIVLFAATKLIPTIMWASSGEIALNWEGYNNYTLSYIFENPISALMIFIRTNIEKGYFYFSTAFGGNLSGLTLKTYFIVPVLSALVLAFTGIASEKDEISFSAKQKTMLTFICASVYGAILMSMFLGWTSDFRTVIEGVQGRYFIPIMLPFVMLLSTKKFKLSFNPSYIVIPVTLIVNGIAVYNVLRYTVVH